jgi:hypothetical protein
VACFCALLALGTTGPREARADDDDYVPRGDVDLGTLPDIKAREFAVTIAKRSTSTRVYVFDDVTGAQTSVGKILLLKHEGEPIMAFRVIKTYPDDKQFAAKRIRRYRDVRTLDIGGNYAALEKVTDVAAPPPTAQDKADLKELENKPATEPEAQASAAPTAPAGPAPEVSAYDPDLDAATSPPPSGGVDSENKNGKPEFDEEEDDSKLGQTIEEAYPIDPSTHWITGGFGFFRDNAGPAGSGYFAGGGIRYGFTLGRMLIMKRAQIQDALVVEGGIFYYKILNFVAQNDAYAVLPLILTARYDLLFGENLGLFFYAGLMHNSVTSSSGANPDVVTALGSTLPAAGTGVLFRVGPSWDARLDVGFDVIGAGLVLRF